GPFAGGRGVRDWLQLSRRPQGRSPHPGPGFSGAHSRATYPGGDGLRKRRARAGHHRLAAAALRLTFLFEPLHALAELVVGQVDQRAGFPELLGDVGLVRAYRLSMKVAKPSASRCTSCRRPSTNTPVCRLSSSKRSSWESNRCSTRVKR